MLAHYFDEPGHKSVEELIGDPKAILEISVLTICEFRVRLQGLGAHEMLVGKVLAGYMQALDGAVPLTEDIALSGADLRARSAHRISVVDVMIAATAKCSGAILVHRDPHFTSLPKSEPVQMVLPDKV